MGNLIGGPRDGQRIGNLPPEIRTAALPIPGDIKSTCFYVRDSTDRWVWTGNRIVRAS